MQVESTGAQPQASQRNQVRRDIPVGELVVLKHVPRSSIVEKSTQTHPVFRHARTGAVIPFDVALALKPELVIRQ